jgi:hypothetical protein
LPCESVNEEVLPASRRHVDFITGVGVWVAVAVGTVVAVFVGVETPCVAKLKSST